MRYSRHFRISAYFLSVSCNNLPPEAHIQQILGSQHFIREMTRQSLMRSRVSCFACSLGQRDDYFLTKCFASDALPRRARTFQKEVLSNRTLANAVTIAASRYSNPVKIVRECNLQFPPAEVFLSSRESAKSRDSAAKFAVSGSARRNENHRNNDP